jgi:hypothetical protein
MNRVRMKERRMKDNGVNMESGQDRVGVIVRTVAQPQQDFHFRLLESCVKLNQV